jgi:predicted transcriptional regulator
VANYPVAVSDLSSLTMQVHSTLSMLGGSSGSAVITAEPKGPAISVMKSVMPDSIVCREDGKKLKMLKRHLQTSFVPTPEQYRTK